MTQRELNVLEPEQMRLRALSRWDNERGAILLGIEGALIFGDAQSEVPLLSNAELAQLRIRVIALENVVIALLAKAPDRQLESRNGSLYLSKTRPHTASADGPCGSRDDSSRRTSSSVPGRDALMSGG